MRSSSRASRYKSRPACAESSRERTTSAWKLSVWDASDRAPLAVMSKSRELSAQAGRDLYRLAREDDRIILPARITGTVGSPVVFIDIAEALKRALRNRAGDQLKSLFDRFRKKVIR